MKATFALALVQSVAMVMAQTRADASDEEAKNICGDLGVMDIPDGVDPSAVRMCREHPSRFSASNSKRETGLEKRKCWNGKAVGCSKDGWCYKTCDNGGAGAWCWTTVGSPGGPWKTCRADSNCSRNDPCSGGGCKDCGCGC